MATLRLKTLTCFETDDYAGTDEPYVKVNGNIVWGPVEVTGAGDVAIEKSVEFEGEASIELWEKDRYSDDELLGTHTVRASDDPGETETRFTYDQAHYRLRYEVT